MKVRRIFGLILRYLYYFKHTLDRMFDVFYWPMMDLLLFGLTSLSFNKQIDPSAGSVYTVLAGVILWIMIWRGQYEVTVNLLEELWRHNLINIFASPLHFSEWVVSVLIVGIIKATVSFTWAGVLGYFIFGVNILKIGPSLWLLCLMLIMTGWCIGFLVSGIVLRFGTKIQTFAWAGAVIIAPFSGVYYPLSVLPDWARAISRFVPSSYVFENARQIIRGEGFNMSFFTIGLLLNLIYITLAYIFLNSSFKKGLERGLTQIY